MHSKAPLLATALAAALAAMTLPAMADCRDEIATLDKQLAKADSDLERKSSDTAKKKAELALPAKPTESWHGSPPGKDKAKEKLENARDMAADGKEDGCMQLVQEVRQMMEDPGPGAAAAPSSGTSESQPRR